MKKAVTQAHYKQLSQAATLVHTNGVVQSSSVLKASAVDLSNLNLSKQKATSTDKSVLYQSYGL